MNIWEGRTVFVTGHTGFKGSWLSLWLHHLGAKVHGYALDMPSPSLFEVAHLRKVLTTTDQGDVNDLNRLQYVMHKVQPSVVFHFAAQPLVRESYRNPIWTFATNVMGTAHCLEAARGGEAVQAVVVITTDKVYENREWVFPYREWDALGGHDPYSASKAAAEMVAASYRESYGMNIATARAGNVIGGGDWSKDRLVPDCLRAFNKGGPVSLRSPEAVRPWQHVLDLLSGYLLLAEKLVESPGYASAWNFGPHDVATVSQVAEGLAHLWGCGAKVEFSSEEHPHETGLLRLDSTKARSELGWLPRWPLERSLRMTMEWQKSWLRGEDMQKKSLEQIQSYMA